MYACTTAIACRLKFFKASTDSAARYKGPRDQESMEAFIREQMDKKPEEQVSDVIAFCVVQLCTYVYVKCGCKMCIYIIQLP